jgi:hypothetical protein
MLPNLVLKKSSKFDHKTSFPVSKKYTIHSSQHSTHTRSEKKITKNHKNHKLYQKSHQFQSQNQHKTSYLICYTNTKHHL